MIPIFISFDVVKNTCVDTSLVIMDKQAFRLHILFLSVLPQHVPLQIACTWGRIPASCASVELFSRMSPFMLLQVGLWRCGIFTLITVMRFLSCVFLCCVFQNMPSQVSWLSGWIVALIAMILFLCCVYQDVLSQIISSFCWIVALIATMWSLSCVF